jgi:hypothetical protein
VKSVEEKTSSTSVPSVLYDSKFKIEHLLVEYFTEGPINVCCCSCSVGCYKTHKENGCSGKNEVKSGSFGLVKEEGELSSSDSETTNAEVDENDIDCRSLQQLGKLIYSL